VRRPGHTLRVFVTRGARLVSCRRARAVARRPPLVRVPRWRAYDWRATGRGPWRTVWARQDRRVVIGLAAVSRAA
jgi:hypothetical protein